MLHTSFNTRCAVLPRELRQYTNRKVFITLGAIIGLAFIATAATVVALSVLLIYRRGAQSYNNSRVNSEALLSDIHQASQLERQYVITGNQADLESYRQLVAQLPGKADHLTETATPSSLMSTVQKIPALVRQILDEQDRTLAVYRSGDVSGTAAALDAGAETNLTDQLKSTISSLESGDIAQLNSDRSYIDMLSKISRDISLASLVLTLVLAVLVHYLYLKGIQAERRLDRAKDEFVSLASHQLRTPATGVKSILATLIAGDVGELTPRQKHFATKALESNERGLAVIEELLNVAKADAGRLVLNPTRFDLAGLVTAVVVEQQPQINAKRIHLSVNVPAAGAGVYADRDKLYMAIGNLVDNACKYTAEEGEIEVSLNERFHDMRLTIADNGQGIAKDDLPRIFERFGRAALTGDHTEGTGLGLYLVSRVVELHHGRIKANSQLGKGSKFVMIIPKRINQAPS